MTGLRAICPAKVNLGLHVFGRCEDGYHEIVTLFQTIDLCDTLDADRANTLSLEVPDGSVAADERNLVTRAARLLVSRSGHRDGARLRLVKKIPVGGGLGGGSSDAAGALVLLNELWNLGLNLSELADLAAELGSDVPFFLWGGTALGTGRGATIQPLPAIGERVVILGIPPFSLATSEVYPALRATLTRTNPDVTVPRLFVKLAEGNDFARATNDLEKVAFGMHGELATFRDALALSGAEVALLSGSGSTVFGLFGAGDDVIEVVEALRGRFPHWTVRVTRTMASGIRIVPAVG